LLENNDPLILKYCMIKHDGNFGHILHFHSLEKTRMFIVQNAIQLEKKSSIQLNGTDSWWIYTVFSKKFYVVISGDAANKPWNHDRIEYFNEEPVLFGVGSVNRVEEKLDFLTKVLIDKKWKY